MRFTHFVALLVFFVPCDSGEKVTLGISALLSMTVFLMTIRESLPPTEKTPLISKSRPDFLWSDKVFALFFIRKCVQLCYLSGFYYGVSICIVTFASAMAVVTLNIHHRGFRGVTVPAYLRFLCLKLLAKVLLVQSEPDGESASNTQPGSTTGDSQLDAFRELRVQLNGLHPTMGHRLDPRSASRKYEYNDGVIQRSPRFEAKSLHTSTSGGGNGQSETGSGAASILHNPCPGSSNEFDFKFGRIATKICETIERCEMRTAEQTKNDANQLEWKKVALVCDRFLFWAFAISTAISTTLILFSSPYGPSFHDLRHNIFGLVATDDDVDASGASFDQNGTGGVSGELTHNGDSSNVPV